MSGIRERSTFSGALVVVLCALAPGLLVGAQPLVEALQAAIPYIPAKGDRVPVWSNGAFLKVQADESAQPEILAVGPGGRTLSSFTLSVPGAQVVRIRGLSRDPAGTTAVSGFSVSDDGRVAAFIAFVSSTRSDLRVIRTEPYHARSVAMWPDGTLWTIGNVSRHSDRKDADPTGGTLRHYDSSGRLLSSYFPESSLDDSLRAMVGFIVASPDRVGWISHGDPSANAPRRGGYVEIERDGNPTLYPLPPLSGDAGAVLYGMGMLEDGSVYVSAVGPDEKQTLYSLDRTTRSWNAVNILGLNGPLTAAFLHGGSGTVLAISAQNFKAVRLFEPAPAR